MPKNLGTIFLRASENLPDRVAISPSESETNYKELARRAKSLGATMQRALPSWEVPLTAILGNRSQTAYSGILGALMAGHGYILLNPTFPIDRTKLMLESSGCRCLIVDARSMPQLARLLSSISRQISIICPDSADVAELAASLPNHQVVGAAELADADNWSLPRVDDYSIAYLVFCFWQYRPTQGA